LAHFPTTRRLPRRAIGLAGRRVARLHRLSEHPEPWWYSSLPRGNGRFDLPAPEGTCYLADDLDTALGEKLLRRPKKLVPAQRLRELFHAVVTATQAPELADLTAKRAAGWGLNAEIHTSLDHARPRAWAATLRAAGAAGLRYAVRSDPALRGRAVALFGAAGRHTRAPAGMRTEVSPLDPHRARALLEARGVLVVPIPRDVPTVTLPR
jgi:hypothetical protein